MDEIIAVIAKIDAYLPGTATREIVSTQEVQDLLLDVRLALVGIRDQEPVLA